MTRTATNGVAGGPLPAPPALSDPTPEAKETQAATEGPAGRPVIGRLVAGFPVRPIPATSPEIISADEAWHGDAPYCQDALALDFGSRLDDEDFGPQPTRRLLLPDPEPLVPRLAQTVMEVVSGSGRRRSSSVTLAPGVYSVLARQSLVASRRRFSGAQRSAVVAGCACASPQTAVVEACAVVVSHGRVRALAMRLEGLDGRWVVTALTIG